MQSKCVGGVYSDVGRWQRSHLPVGRTVNLIVHSNDVIHSFWIPALRGKRDAIPGHTNS